MTTPVRINGVPSEVMAQYRRHNEKMRIRSCESKRRHPDELTARAAGCALMEKNNGDPRLFIYKCKHCRGWHLTKIERPPYFAVDYFEKEAYK